MRTNGVFLKATLVAVILAMNLAGCTLVDAISHGTHEHVDGGMLPFGDTSIHECFPMGVSDEILLGDMIGPPTDDITIDSVEMNGMTGMTVVGVFLLDPAYGMPYATSFLPLTTPIWEHRVNAVGATLQIGNQRNIVVQVAVKDGVPAQLESVTVNYHSDSGRASNTGLVSYEMAPSCG